MAKIITPPDLVQQHSHIEKRVTWLETHATNSPGESASIVKHTHDIVEHLFRGSMQAHTGAAPFGHLASHFWDREHDDPALTDNWDFHRKMRVLRERVGANRPLVDMIGPSLGIIINKGAGIGVSRGWVYYGEGKYRRAVDRPAIITGEHGLYNLVARGSQVVQPLVFPGDPACQNDANLSEHPAFPQYTEWEYSRTEGPGKPAVPPKVQMYEPNPTYDAETKSEGGASQVIRVVATSCDEAVAKIDPIGFATGGSINALSKRWGGYHMDELFPHAITGPDPALDGAVTSIYDAVFGASMPRDIFVWCNLTGSVMSIYGENGADPLSTIALPTKTKLSTAPRTTSKTSVVYGSMWYLTENPSGYRPTTKMPSSSAIYIPADFIQSPGPPVDADNTQPLPALMAVEVEDIPPQPGGGYGNNFAPGTFEDPEVPLRTFAEAIAIFEAEIVDSMFAELVEFWERHLTDFTKRGEAFNHKWQDVYEPGKAPIGGHSAFLQRYGHVHWRGRLVTTGNWAAGPEHEIWHLPEAAPQPLDPVLTFTVNSNIGLVLLRMEGRHVTLPAIADVGSSSGSKLVWIDLDGIMYPHE